MSNSIKIALLALVLLPVLAIWLFLGRPTGDGAPGSPAAVSPSVPEKAPVALAAPATSPPAPVAIAAPSSAALEPSPASSSIGADGEVRARLMLRRRPEFLKGTPAGCDPPFTTDSDGNKHYKKECF
jgi:hypothetical protein